MGGVFPGGHFLLPRWGGFLVKVHKEGAEHRYTFRALAPLPNTGAGNLILGIPGWFAVEHVLAVGEVLLAAAIHIDNVDIAI